MSRITVSAQLFHTSFVPSWQYQVISGFVLHWKQCAALCCSESRVVQMHYCLACAFEWFKRPSYSDAPLTGSKPGLWYTSSGNRPLMIFLTSWSRYLKLTEEQLLSPWNPIFSEDWTSPFLSALIGQAEPGFRLLSQLCTIWGPFRLFYQPCSVVQSKRAGIFMYFPLQFISLDLL